MQRSELKMFAHKTQRFDFIAPVITNEHSVGVSFITIVVIKTLVKWLRITRRPCQLLSSFRYSVDLASSIYFCLNEAFFFSRPRDIFRSEKNFLPKNNRAATTPTIFIRHTMKLRLAQTMRRKENVTTTKWNRFLIFLSFLIALFWWRFWNSL